LASRHLKLREVASGLLLFIVRVMASPTIMRKPYIKFMKLAAWRRLHNKPS